MTLSGQLRIRILERDGYRCIYCGQSSRSAVLQVDHVVPRARGGSDDPTNLVTACYECNAGKSDDLVALPDYIVLATLPPIASPRVPIHRRGWEFEANIRWPEDHDMLEMAGGRGRYADTRFAVVSWCAALRVRLHHTAMEAGNAMSALVHGGCDHGCRGDHQLVDMAVPEVIDQAAEKLRGLRRARHIQECGPCESTSAGRGPAAALRRAVDRSAAGTWPCP